MIAYLFWHRAYPTTTVEQYEEALMRFQQRLGQQQPPGFGGSASFRVAALPWLGNRPGYEDWCLLDGSWALDPLNAFAVAGPVISAHDSAAAQMEEGHGGLYALVWGLVRNSLSSCRPISMSPRQQAGRRWPSSACASMHALIRNRRSAICTKVPSAICTMLLSTAEVSVGNQPASLIGRARA